MIIENFYIYLSKSQILVISSLNSLKDFKNVMQHVYDYKINTPFSGICMFDIYVLYENNIFERIEIENYKYEINNWKK